MATHSSVLAWRIPGTGEPGGLPSMGLYRVGHDWSDLAAAAAASLSTGYFMPLSWGFLYPNICSIRSVLSESLSWLDLLTPCTYFGLSWLFKNCSCCVLDPLSSRSVYVLAIIYAMIVSFYLESFPQVLLPVCLCAFSCLLSALLVQLRGFHSIIFHLFCILAVFGLRCSTHASLVTALALCGVRARSPCTMWDRDSLTRDWTLIPCIGRWILNHWITGEVPYNLF